MIAPEPSTDQTLRRVAVLVAMAGAASVAGLTLTPIAWWINRLTVRIYVFFREDLPIAPDSATPEHYAVLLNVALFVPLAAGLTLLGRWSAWKVVLGCALASAAIECAQLGMDRDPSVVDVVANTAGAALGVALVALARRVSRDVRRLR